MSLSVGCPNPNCKYPFWMKEDLEYKNVNYHFFKCVRCDTSVYIPRQVIVNTTCNDKGKDRE